MAFPKKSQELRKNEKEKNIRIFYLNRTLKILDKKKCPGIALRKYRDYIYFVIYRG